MEGKRVAIAKFEQRSTEAASSKQESSQGNLSEQKTGNWQPDSIALELSGSW